MVMPWDLPHSDIECYSGKADQIDPCCEIVYFAPGVLFPYEFGGAYMSPCIGDDEDFPSLQSCRDRLDELFPPVTPPPEMYVVGVAMYEEDEYIIGTLIVDGVRYTGEQFKVTGQMEAGVHIFLVEPPEGYTFVEWQVYEYGGPLLYTSTERILSVDIDRHTWIWAEVKRVLPPSAIATVRGRATGGFPAPDMRLYVYDNDVLIGYEDFSAVSLGSWYTFEKVLTGAGIHRVYGKMRLSNELGTFNFETETEEFELG